MVISSILWKKINSEHRTMEVENKPYIMAQMMSGWLAMMLGTFFPHSFECIIFDYFISHLALVIWHAILGSLFWFEVILTSNFELNCFGLESLGERSCSGWEVNRFTGGACRLNLVLVYYLTFYCRIRTPVPQGVSMYSTCFHATKQVKCVSFWHY